MLIAGLGTVYQFDGDTGAKLVARFPYSGALMWASRGRPGRVFLGTRSELRSLRFDERSAQWIDEGSVPGITAEIHPYAETAAGDLWVGSIDRGLFRVQFAGDDASGQRGAATITDFLGKPGPLSDVVETWVSAAPGGGVIAGTRRGLCRYDAAARNFCPATEYGARFVDGSFGVDRFVPDEEEGVWLTGRSTRIPWLDQQGGWAKAGKAESDRQQAIDAGCDDFVPKPFTEEQLLAILGRVLMLEWVYEPSQGLSSPQLAVAEDGTTPPAAEIDALLELSRRGDIRGIKTRLGTLRAADARPGSGGFVRRLDPLVAGYQMDRIRDILTHYRNHGNTHE